MHIETPLNQITDSRFRDLCAAIEGYMAETGIPGTAVGVLQDGHVLTNGFGVTHFENPLPVTSDTLFHIGSTTKTMTAALVMMLVDEGKLDLDAPVRTYLPNLELADESVAAAVTMRHLLTHVGGWDGDFFDPFGGGDDSLAQYVAHVKTRPQLFPLGKVWAYNNAAFGIASRVVEVLNADAYENVLKARLLDPLGMTDSLIFEYQIMLRRFATGHIITSDGLKLPERWQFDRSISGIGRVSSTVKDQMIYGRFMLDGGMTADSKRLISEGSFAEMQKNQHTVGDYVDYMGLSWMVTEGDGFRILAHGGTTRGQLSAFFFVPEKHFAFTILSNGAGQTADMRAFCTKWVRKHYLGMEETPPQPLSTQPTLAEYAGVYNLAEVKFSFVEDGDRLKVTVTGPDFLKSMLPLPYTVQAYAADRFICADEKSSEHGEKFRFIRDDEGKIFAVGNSVRAYARVD